jgi:hypothetical protein
MAIASGKAPALIGVRGLFVAVSIEVTDRPPVGQGSA